MFEMAWPQTAIWRHAISSMNGRLPVTFCRGLAAKPELKIAASVVRRHWKLSSADQVCSSLFMDMRIRAAASELSRKSRTVADGRNQFSNLVAPRGSDSNATFEREQH